eukprot:PhF_6_TR9585/c0_g1_i1/m.14842
MPPKSAKAKAPPPQKAQARKAPAKASPHRQATKTLGTPQLAAATKESVSPPDDKPKAPKRSREEEYQPGKDDQPALAPAISISQGYRDLMEANGADTFRA